MFNPLKFLKFFLFGAGLVGAIFIPYYFLALFIGEINIDRVIEKQLSNANTKNVFFRSGLNQFAFPYKTKLMKREKPKIVVLGSSRSTQVRKQFFNQKFINLGGAIQGVTDIEDYLNFLNSNALPTDLSILFIDPWWFNEKVSAGGGMHQLEYPTGVSIDHLIESLKLLKKGNWIKLSFENDHLGIAAILTQQGYGPDGSNNYTKYVSKDGRKTDIRFEDTIYRIKDSKYPFQTIDRPTPNLIIRACSAIKNISKKTDNLILVAPPFAPTVSDALLNSSQNAYMEKAYESLEKCLGIKIHDYLYTSNAYDCEFLDGFHGGDTTYARIILDLFLNKDINSRFINADFLQQFIKDESGFASGFTRHQFQKYPEVDFLQLGCQKS
tara:strand:- start:2008 stop:3153 length:1146 start_codon:yes stop_codon:yes gene_type:complete